MRKNIKYYKIDFNALFILGTGPEWKDKAQDKPVLK